MCAQLPDPLDDLVAGLRAEARALRRQSPRDQPVVKLTGGRRVKQQRTGNTYRFTMQQRSQQLESARNLLIESSQSAGWHQVQQCEFSDKDVTVTCEVDLGKADIATRLRKDDAAGLDALDRALQELGTHENKEALQRGRKALGSGKVKTGTFTDAEKVTSRLSTLNQAQQQGVRQALGSELSYLWGPPGTGKTEVVARIVEGYVRRGFRVLFTAPTNVAVDQALERVCDLVAPLPEFDRGLVRRVGEIHVGTLRDNYGQRIGRDETISRHSQELNRRVVELREAQQGITADLEVATHLEELDSELRAKQEQRATHAQRLQPQLNSIATVESTITELQQRLAGGTPRSAVRRRREEAKRERWARELQEQQDELARMREAINGPAATLQRMDDAIEELRTRLRQETPDHLQSRSELEQRSTQIQQELERITAELRQLEREIDQNCQVAAMTTQRSYLSRPPLVGVDVVVVDEAGMVDLPTVFHLSSMATSSIVFAGDFRQLPTVVTGATDKRVTRQEREHVADWFATDAFHAGGVAGGSGINTDDSRLVRLDTQYRMHPGICDLVNTVAYPDAPLQTGRLSDDAPGQSPLLEAPLVLIDTSGHTGGRGTASSNYVHAELLREFVRLLQHDQVLPVRRAADANPADTMAAIAPYRDQVSAIGKHMKERFGPDVEGVVDTVHRFQGSQRDIIMVDTVSGASKSLGSFFTGVGLDSDTCRLLNVALSRAREHLVVVANVEHLAGNLKATSEVHNLLDHMKHYAQLVSPDDLIPVRAADELDKLDDEELTQPAFFPVDETDRAIEWDFARARTRIEIYCPFMNRPRVKRYRKPLRDAVQRGATVSVFTRDASEVPANEPLIEVLREEGCEVVTRDQMHEKVVVADDVLWHGSLNLFAHTRSTELMMRLVNAEACDEVRKTVEAAKPTRRRSTTSGGPYPIV